MKKSLCLKIYVTVEKGIIMMSTTSKRHRRIKIPQFTSSSLPVEHQIYLAKWLEINNTIGYEPI